MLVVESIESLRSHVESWKADGLRIGVVPTMGALHEGHLSLVTAAISECDRVIATIFVNPTQFAAGEDLSSYPRTLSSDVEQLEAMGVSLVFAPTEDVIYPENFSTFVLPPSVSERLEGVHRPTHFRGVATVVLKLLNLASADRAYFGQKDFQQSLVIRRMVDDLNLDVEIVICPIVRDDDGLALSSRNSYLSAEQRVSALAISQSLRAARQSIESGCSDAATVINEIQRRLSDAGVDRVDYIAVASPDYLEPMSEISRPVVLLIAAHVGSTRLIDNELIT